MTDLSDPAIREAGARALSELFSRIGLEWEARSEPNKDRWRRDWSAVVRELGPVIQQVEIREQMRGGIDDAGEEGQ